MTTLARLPEGPYPRVEIESVKGRMMGEDILLWYAIWYAGFAPKTLEIGNIEPGCAILQGPLRYDRRAAEADGEALRPAASAAHDAMLARTRHGQVLATIEPG